MSNQPAIVFNSFATMTDAQKFKAEFEEAQKAYNSKSMSEGESKLGNENTEQDEESDKLADDLDKLKVEEGGESREPSTEDCSGTEKDCKKDEQSTETSKVEDGGKADS